MLNLFDLTEGNYRIRRTVTYPDFPASQLDFETEVKAVQRKEWSTTIAISGKYDGPTDVVGVRDYQLAWSTDGQTLLEKGSAVLQLSSGKTVRSVWTSSIIPDKPSFAKFPSGGETATVTFSPFRIDGNKMSYEWEGTVR